jgi:hypothetical protein
VPDSSRRDVLVSTLLFKPKDVLKSAVVASLHRLTGRRLGDEDATSVAESTDSMAASSSSEPEDE